MPGPSRRHSTIVLCLSIGCNVGGWPAHQRHHGDCPVAENRVVVSLQGVDHADTAAAREVALGFQVFGPMALTTTITWSGAATLKHVYAVPAGSQRHALPDDPAVLNGLEYEGHAVCAVALRASEPRRFDSLVARLHRLGA